jgi:hypothetical protein
MDKFTVKAKNDRLNDEKQPEGGAITQGTTIERCRRWAAVIAQPSWEKSFRQSEK